jgi:tetratricopeptide (TPR) repeat protein
VIEPRQAASFVLAACLLALTSGCVTRGALIERSSNQTVELTDTPFFPQRIHQCGPAALATTLVASKVEVTPDELEPFVYLPQKHGSLQVEMLAAPRKYGRLTYTLEPELDSILDELDAARPVLILHNYGLPFLPRWHYAVVIGYDAQKDEVVLRSGTAERLVLSARNFMRAWDNGGRWAMVVLKPGELPAAQADKGRYLESAAGFERAATPHEAFLVFNAATQRWPDEPIAWIGRGTAHYRSGDLNNAAKDYAEALRLDAAQAGARNNLAMTLLDLGCAEQARVELGKIDTAYLKGSLRDAVADTQAQLARRAPSLGAQSCHLQ